MTQMSKYLIKRPKVDLKTLCRGLLQMQLPIVSAKAVEFGSPFSLALAGTKEFLFASVEGS